MEEEEIRINTRNDIHLSPRILAALDCRSDDKVCVDVKEGEVVLRKKEEKEAIK